MRADLIWRSLGATLLALAVAYAVWSTQFMWRHRDYFPIHDAVTAEVFLRYLWNGWNPLEFFQWYANEHRPAFPMAILALDRILSGTVGPISTIAMYMCALLLGALYFLVDPKTRIDTRHLMFGAAVLVIFFWPGHWENFVWSSQIQILLAVTSGLAALVLLVRTPDGHAISIRRSAVVSALLFISCFSFAIGFVFAASAFVVSFVRFGWSKVVIGTLLVLISGAAIYAMVFWGRDQFGYTAGNIVDPHRFFIFVLRYVGGPITVALEKTLAFAGIHFSQAVRLRLAAGIGAGAAVYALCVTFSLARLLMTGRQQEIAPHHWLAFGLSGFVFGNAFVTAMGRSFSPPNYPIDVARYYVSVLVFWVGMLAHATLGKPRSLKVVAPVLGAFIFIFAVSGFSYRGDIRAHAAADRRAGVAGMSRLSDAWPMFWLPDVLPDLYARYEADRVLTFSQDWARTFARNLPAQRQDGVCKGRVLSTARLAGLDRSYQLTGTFSEPGSTEWLVISDSRVARGFGAAQRSSEDAQDTPWIAYARDADLPLNVDVVLPTGALCRIGSIDVLDAAPVPTQRQPYRTDFEAAAAAAAPVNLNCPENTERVRWVDGRLLCMPMRDLASDPG